MTLKEEVNLKKEILALIDWLSKFGSTKSGGITREVYTDEWLEAQNSLKELAEGKKFKSYYDEVGNLFIKSAGSTYINETILTGSHIDTVIDGGKYDGQLGIISGLIAMEYLRDKYGEPLRNVEVVSMAEEEGTRFPFGYWGSKNIVGSVEREEVEDLKDSDGLGFVDEMHRAGFDFKGKTGKTRDDIKSFVELHIEQGGVLEAEEKSIGIVTSIVGMKRLVIEIDGESNHAGTTPMGYRKDALHGASKMIDKVLNTAIEYGDPLVATVGTITIKPNAINVIPGKSSFTLDIRHTNNEVLEKYIGEIKTIIKEIAAASNLKVKINRWMDEHPVEMDKDLVNMLEGICKEKELSYKLMHSGAGHDSQVIAQFFPAVMIFVPSHKGVSHSPKEFTHIEDIIEGTKVLIEALYSLAYK